MYMRILFLGYAASRILALLRECGFLRGVVTLRLLRRYDVATLTA
jgi:hypothetical protein